MWLDLGAIFKPITFEFSHLFLYWMVIPLDYIKRCLAHENSRLIYEWIAAKIACFLTLLSSLSRIDTLIFFFTFSKWYGPNQSLSIPLMHLQGNHSSIGAILVRSNHYLPPIHISILQETNSEMESTPSNNATTTPP